jgi:hypothetical protein
VPASDLKPILHLYTRPAAAMSDLLDRGSLFLSSVAVLAISFALSRITVVFPFPFYGPLFGLAAIYVPGLLFIGGLISRLSGGFHSVFQRDYAPLLTCVAAAWSATNLPLLAIAWFAPAIFPMAALLAYAWLLVLIFFAVRTVSARRAVRRLALWRFRGRLCLRPICCAGRSNTWRAGSFLRFC